MMARSRSAEARPLRWKQAQPCGSCRPHAGGERIHPHRAGALTRFVPPFAGKETPAVAARRWPGFQLNAMRLMGGPRTRAAPGTAAAMALDASSLGEWTDGIFEILHRSPDF